MLTVRWWVICTHSVFTCRAIIWWGWIMCLTSVIVLITFIFYAVFVFYTVFEFSSVATLRCKICVVFHLFMLSDNFLWSVHVVVHLYLLRAVNNVDGDDAAESQPLPRNEWHLSEGSSSKKSQSITKRFSQGIHCLP